MGKKMRRQLNAEAAIAVTLTLAHAPITPAMAFVWPALFPEAGRGVGKGCLHGVQGECCGIDSSRCSSIVRRPQQHGRNSRERAVYGGQFGLFGWDTGAGTTISGSDRPTPTAARTNGANVGEVLAPGGVSTKMDKAKQQQHPFFTLPAFLQNIVPSEESSISSDHAASHSDVVAGGVVGDGWEGKDDVAADAAMGAEQTVPAAEAHTNSEEGGGVSGNMGGVSGLPMGVKRNVEHGVDDSNEEDDEGGEQECGRKRDMYKIRSLLLQGQIAGLRERLKERELDVRELRVLTGGRGQSKLRELGALLKEARKECDALRAREQALAEELATCQKEGDILRGDLLANQKALSDLNVYADSLRSRYTAEMVKLEASLAEMERELTRAEAAHMRERRDLLDKEASAVADGARYRNRAILLQGEVLKTRARESKLRDENARLLATYEATAAAAATATTDETPAIADKTKEEEAVRRENKELRARLETALPRAGQRGQGKPDVAATELSSDPSTREISSDSAKEVSSPTMMSEETKTVAVEIVEGAEGIDDDGSARRVEEAGSKTTAIARAAGFADEASARRAYEEAGVARVVAGLREENVRLRKRLRAAEIAADVGEARADEEATRGDELEAELARVRIAVKGKVQTLKTALEEAEADAEQAVAEKDEHMRQWAEDVDALRAQLVAERRAWETDRSELEEIVAELEDEMKNLKAQYRGRNEGADDGQVQSQRQKRRSPQGNNSGTGKSNASGSRVSGGGKKSLKSDRRSRVRSVGWWPGEDKRVPVSASYPGDREYEKNKEEERCPEDKGVSPLGDAQKASSEEQWDKAMRLLQYLY